MKKKTVCQTDLLHQYFRSQECCINALFVCGLSLNTIALKTWKKTINVFLIQLICGLIDFEIRYSNQPLASINISFQKSMITHTYLTRRQYNYGLLITYILSGSVLHIQLGMKLEHDSQGQLRTKLYDKRGGLIFPIVYFPFVCRNIPTSLSYGVYILVYTTKCAYSPVNLPFYLKLIAK